MPVGCPGCGEELPEGARFCGACGRLMATPPPDVVLCPLCRTEVPAGARFCGACGQPLYAGDSLPGASSASLPEGMLRVPLIHGRPHDAPGGGEAEYADLATLQVEVDDDVEQAHAHFQLVEVDALARRGLLEDALRRLMAVHGVPPGDPRLHERLGTLALELGRSVAARGRAGAVDAAGLRAELRRLSALCPDPAYRETLRAEIVPAAVAEDAVRAREAARDGHLHAAVTLVEKLLPLGPHLPELRTLQHDVVQAVVARAWAEQQAGDRAWRSGDGEGAAAHYAEALELLPEDRILLARLERARHGVPAAPGRSRPGPPGSSGG